MSDKKNKNPERLWVTFPNKESKERAKKILTEDFGSSGFGIYALIQIYSDPNRSMYLSQVAHANEMIKNCTENTKEIYKIKRFLDELKKNIKEKNDKNKKEEIQENEQSKW